MRVGIDLRHIKAGRNVRIALAQVKQRSRAQLLLLGCRNELARRAVSQVCAQLDLNKQQRAVLLGDEVDLAEAAGPPRAARYSATSDSPQSPSCFVLIAAPPTF